MNAAMIVPTYVPLVVAGGGLGCGLLIALWQQPRTLGAQARLQARLIDLAAEMDQLLSRIRELDEDSLGLGHKEREELTARLAHLLQERDVAQAKLAKGAPKVNPRSIRFALSPQLKGALWGAGSVALMGLLLFYVSRDAVPRVDSARPMADRDETPVASSPATAAAAVGQEDNRAEFAAIQSAWKSTPTT